MTAATITSDFERARSALQVFNSDDRKTWVYRGMELKSEFGYAGFDLWDEWGATSERYNAKDARAAWKSFKNRPGGRTIASLFHEARQAGWNDDTRYTRPSREELDRRAADRQKRDADAAAQEVAAHAAAAERALKIWDAAAPKQDALTPTHQYLTDKGVQAHGLRIGDWPFEVTDWETGEILTRVKKGCALIQVRDRKGTLRSLQAIDAKGTKMFLKDGEVSGNFCAIGEPMKDDLGRPVYVLAEGFATAASVHEATGKLVLCCFDVGNVVAVARAIRASKRDAVIIIACDNDVETRGNPGLVNAFSVALEVGALLAVPMLYGLPERKCDFNDLSAIEGLAVVSETIAKAKSMAREVVITLAPDAEAMMGAAYALRVMDSGAEFEAAEGGTIAGSGHRDYVFALHGDDLAASAIALRERYPDARIYVLGRSGEEQSARDAAHAVGGVAELIDEQEGAQSESWFEFFMAQVDAKADADPAARKLAERALGQASAAQQQATPAAAPTRDEERRHQQQEENLRLQEADQGTMIPKLLTVDEMAERCVWIAEGEVVAYVTESRSQFLTFKEFKSLTSESMTFAESEDGKKPKGMLTAKLWQSDSRRQDAMTRTFRAGADVICADPDGARAVNLWRPIKRRPAGASIDLFLGHIAYLFEDVAEREAFLDWLAHLDQQPGVLPHFGWLHIASHTGCGRNWVASVLARVFRGVVAPNVDLPALLDSPYNGAIASRVLAIVDEVQEGGGENYRHKNKLRSLLNAEVRHVNPKFGRQFYEFNACRWLVFSNHKNALPLDNTDRRWRVVVHEREPRPSEDYERLYAALADPEFINAVGAFLRERDISRFKPGERPPLNDAKLAVISASKPMQEQHAEEMITNWPADIISNSHAAEILADTPKANFTPAMRRALEEAGAVGLGRQIKIGGWPQRVWILRNVEKWAKQSNDAIRHEAERAKAHGVHGDVTAAHILAEASDHEAPI